MSEKGFISRKFDDIRERKANKTRIHDKDLARAMAEKELPYRNAARAQRSIGKSLVSLMWSKYPDVRGGKKITIQEVADETGGEFSDAKIVATVRDGIRGAADDYDRKQPLPMTERGMDRQIARVKEIRNADPTAVPHSLASNVGYRLQDDAKETVKLGISKAEAIQQASESGEQTKGLDKVA